jgi:hypothetical protein
MRALKQLFHWVRERPSLMIQAIPIWLSFLDPSFIPTQEQLAADSYDMLFEARAADCADAISMHEGPMSRPVPMAHSDPASLALIVSGLHCAQAWAEHFLRVCLEDPLGPQAKRFWPCVQNLLSLLRYENCVADTVLQIALPLWIAEARKRSVRQGEIQFGPWGQYIAGNYIALVLPTVKDDSPFHSSLEAAGEEFADAAYRHLQLALSEPGIEELSLSHAERTLMCLCTWVSSQRLRNPPEVFEERVVDAVMRVYAFAKRMQTKARDAARWQDTQAVMILCCQYLEAGIDSTDGYNMIAHAISQGLLPLLIRTNPWREEDSKIMSKHNPVALLFERNILGNMFILPIFGAVVKARLAMQSEGTTPLPETSAWYDVLVQRVERWVAPYKRALEVEASIRQERRCHYSRVSPGLILIIRLS